jgi:hypothetical protein
MQSDEAREDDLEGHANRATSTKRSLNTTRRKRGPRPRTQPTPLPKPRRPLDGLPMEPFGVNVASRARADRENAPAPAARGAMGLPESKVGWVNDCFIIDR